MEQGLLWQKTNKIILGGIIMAELDYERMFKKLAACIAVEEKKIKDHLKDYPDDEYFRGANIMCLTFRHFARCEYFGCNFNDEKYNFEEVFAKEYGL